MSKRLDEFSFGNIIGHSSKIQEVYSELKRVAGSDLLCFACETGTGKELAARAIHYNSARKSYPFVKVSCALYQETLLESGSSVTKKGPIPVLIAVRSACLRRR